MRQTRTLPRTLTRVAATPLHGNERETRGIVTAGIVAAVVLGVLAMILWAAASVPPATPSVHDAAGDLSPRTPIKISVLNAGGSVSQVTLSESIRDLDGVLDAERNVPIRMVPLSSGTLWSTYGVEREDGSPLLAYDGLYRLTLTSSSTVTGLFSSTSGTQTYTFSTLTSPRLRPSEGAVQLSYQKPLELRWNTPIKSFAVETSPPLSVQPTVDPGRPNVGYVDMGAATPGTEYEVRVISAIATSGAEMVAPAQIRVLTPTPPELVLDRVKVEDSSSISLPWDRPITSFDYEITPAVESTSQVDTVDPRQARIALANPKQGQEYTIRIRSAIAATGAPLSGSREVKVTTPKALTVEDVLPDQQRDFAPVDGRIAIRFSEPVKDRTAAEAALKITPAVQGTFEWPKPNSMHFVPRENLPYSTEFTVRVAGGKEGVVGTGGGYLDKPLQYSFTTIPNKAIEVNLSQQKLILWENGNAVFTTLVSTGVRGAETPTGTFKVDYKMASTRMRGTNPSGLTYDLADVPWVMSFQGDYTIHGAYWRETYGVQQSNGCVSLPVSVAKKVYDWSPEGIPVRIHY